jgi:hypothetical protein
MKNKLRNSLLILTFALVGVYFFNATGEKIKVTKLEADVAIKTKKKTQEERMLFSEERERHEFNMQKNPATGKIPLEEKEKEYLNALVAKQNAANRTTSSTYTSRGPTNLGGRTRAMAVDISDATSNTILAGGISSGLFRTTNGGASWTKVSSNGEIHNVSALAQDPRAGFQNIWYYGTGEWSGNSASLGSAYRGLGVWKSTDSGVTWTQIAATSSTYESYDSYFDYIMALEVSPLNGDLMIAATGKIYRFDGTTMTIEVEESGGGAGWTDVAINAAGVVYASIEGTSPENGIYTSPTGNGSWTRIAQNGTPAAWSGSGRTVLASAPSDNNIIYVLYMNNGGVFDADLWQYNAGTTTWTNYSSKLPDEVGGDLAGNDPFTAQGGYDLVVSVKPDNANFVVIGGSNAYKITDITNAFETQFTRIGGYNNNLSYALYPNHHPDIHVLEFDPNNSSILFSGTDGGVHRTDNIAAGSIAWTSLNNNYQTYQFYHVAMDPTSGSNGVIGGAQDNGTNTGGTDLGYGDNTTMSSYYGGDGVAVAFGKRDGGLNDQYFYGSQRGNARTNYGGFRSINPVPSGSTQNAFVTYFYLDPDNNDYLYFAGNTTQFGYSDLYRTSNAATITTTIDASNWIDMGDLPSGANIGSMATTRGTYSASSYLMIGGQNGDVYRLDDPQSKSDLTTAVTMVLPGVSAGTYVSGIAIHPTNPDIAMAVMANYGANSIYVTSNATTSSPTWTLAERNLSAHSVRSATITEVGAETIYFVGTARGLYSSADPINVDWDIEGTNEIGFAVISGLVYRPADKRMLIGTHGNGMWETTVENTLSVNDFELANKITLYPNPTQSELNFKTSFNINDASYSIIDVTGKTVNKGIISNGKVDVSKLNSGLYFVNLDVNGVKQTLKFIKK